MPTRMFWISVLYIKYEESSFYIVTRTVIMFMVWAPYCNMVLIVGSVFGVANSVFFHWNVFLDQGRWYVSQLLLLLISLKHECEHYIV